MPRWRRLFRGAWRGLPVLGVSIVLAGVLVRLTVRDAVLGLSVLFYAVPPSVMVLLLGLGGGAWLARRRWRAGGIVLAGAAACAAWHAVAFCAWNPVSSAVDSPATITVLLWNVAGGSHGWTGIARELERWDPDIACFIESGAASEERDSFWNQSLRGMKWKRLDGRMIVAARGEIGETIPLDLGPGGKAAVVRVTVKGQPLIVVPVDIRPNPFLSRREALERLADAAGPLAGDSVLVLGDFNTPRDSIFFDRLRVLYRHAFEEVGRGNDGTWPMPAPVLSIDHLWHSAGVRVSECILEGTWASDHRAVLADVENVRP